MAKRKTVLDRAIEKLDAEIATLQNVRVRLVEQQRADAKVKVKPVAKVS